MDTSQFGKYLTDEQKLGHYDTLMQEWGKLKDENDMLKQKCQEMLQLMHDWALVQHRIEEFARTYRA